MLQIRQSANKKFYNLLEIDSEGNEELVATSPDLGILRSENPNARELQVVPESETRNTVDPPSQESV